MIGRLAQTTLHRYRRRPMPPLGNPELMGTTCQQSCLTLFQALADWCIIVQRRSSKHTAFAIRTRTRGAPAAGPQRLALDGARVVHSACCTRG
eukprot:4769910-Pyramimonas_sp.AAC.1